MRRYRTAPAVPACSPHPVHALHRTAQKLRTTGIGDCSRLRGHHRNGRAVFVGAALALRRPSCKPIRRDVAADLEIRPIGPSLRPSSTACSRRFSALCFGMVHRRSGARRCARRVSQRRCDGKGQGIETAVRLAAIGPLCLPCCATAQSLRACPTGIRDRLTAATAAAGICRWVRLVCAACLQYRAGAFT